MKTRTRANFETAMQSEAFAYAQCTRFAAAARRHANGEMANTFESVAELDRCGHFAQAFALCCPSGSELDNLKAACDFKARQINMYQQFFRDAVQDGELKAAALFNKIREEETGQLETLKAAVEKASDVAVEELVAV